MSGDKRREKSEYNKTIDTPIHGHSNISEQEKQPPTNITENNNDAVGSSNENQSNSEEKKHKEKNKPVVSTLKPGLPNDGTD